MKNDRSTAADRFHSAAIHALRYARREDEASGLSPARLSALSVLVFGGSKTIGELAAAEQVRPPTMSTIVDGLEGGGLVKRAAARKGKRVLHRARERRIAALAGRLSHLDAREIELVSEAAGLVEASLRR